MIKRCQNNYPCSYSTFDRASSLAFFIRPSGTHFEMFSLRTTDVRRVSEWHYNGHWFLTWFPS